MSRAIRKQLISIVESLEEVNRIIRNSFLKTEIGIYDDISDMYAAIAVSDGYYGDGSSVVQLYRQTGKPVMIQNVEIK